jgi:hypothetical protein
MRALLLLTLLAAAPTRAGEGWPDIDTPLRTGADASSDAAVVIGNEDYDDIADVPYAGADAAAFRSFLLYTRGVPLSNLQMLSDASPKQMERAVEKAAAQVGKGGVLWVYYAGHGAAHPVTKERVLLGENAILDPDPEIFEEGAVELEVLKRAAASAQGQAVFVVDACYSGTGRGGDALGDGRFAVPPSYDAGSSVIEWTATQPKQVASPLHATGHGAFTYFAVGALRGWADGELGRRDGAVTLEEAQAYVSTALLEVGQRDQTPAVVGEDALALVDSRGLESAPDLRSLSARVAVGSLRIWTCRRRWRRRPARTTRSARRPRSGRRGYRRRRSRWRGRRRRRGPGWALKRRRAWGWSWRSGRRASPRSRSTSDGRMRWRCL